MIIVTGHLVLDPADRDAYLAECRAVVDRGRAADGALDFSLSADLVDPARIDVLERWESRELLEAFRGGGTPGELATRIRHAEVAEYDVAAVHPLT